MSILWAALLSSLGAGKTIYVDDDGPADFKTIQAAIEDSNNGDVIIVAPGTYTGPGNCNIDFKGKAITVRSTDPNDSNIVANTIIDPNGTKAYPRCGFYFHNGEDPNSIVAGFTIKNGYGLLRYYTLGGAYQGGGILCYGETGPTISHCIIKGNEAEAGGGIMCNASNPVIRNCIISENSARYGGGIQIRGAGPKIVNCTIVNNRAGVGGGLYYHGITYRAISNCIIWDNYATMDRPEISTDSPVVMFCDVKGGFEGEGNINADPCFVDPGYWEDPCNTPTNPWDDVLIGGDYHLKSQAGRWDPNSQSWVKDDVTSPCIDAGDPNSPIGFEPFPNGGIINMGAYGGTAKASKSYFGEPICETIVAGDINGDCIVNLKDFAFLTYRWLEEH